MNDTIIKRWNEVVSKEDIVYHLGDFAFGDKNLIQNLLSHLKGRIRLVMGNHDNYSPTTYLELGFDRVYDKPILYNDFFILSHKPIEWLDQRGVYANLFGHIHNDRRFAWTTARSFNVCADVQKFAPVQFEEIIKHMRLAEQIEKELWDEQEEEEGCFL